MNVNEDSESNCHALLLEPTFIEDPKKENEIRSINKLKLTFIVIIINLPGLLYGYTSTDSN